MSEADRTALIEVPEINAATIMTRMTAGHDQLAAQFGVKPPTRSAHVKTAGMRLVGTGLGTWLALTEQPHKDWLPGLERNLAGLASISDQSGAYRLFKIVGPHARALLQQGAFIDLDPEMFGPNAAATTVIAHIGVTFWQNEADNCFDVAVFRSYGPSFRHWFKSVSRTS